MIAEHERAKMLAVRLCGERVLERLESIGVRRLADLRGRDPWELMYEINLEAGRPIWHAPMATPRAPEPRGRRRAGATPYRFEAGTWLRPHQGGPNVGRR